MAREIINNGETGLTIRSKINSNFAELYNQSPGLSFYPSNFFPASLWIPRTTNGCGVDSRELSNNNYDELLFDASTVEYAQLLMLPPSNFNTLNARFYWTASSSSGGPLSAVTWGMQARLLSDNNPLSSTMGVMLTTSDVLLRVNHMHVSTATPTITSAGTVGANTPILLQISRETLAPTDDLGVDARLLGVEVVFN